MLASRHRGAVRPRSDARAAGAPRRGHLRHKSGCPLLLEATGFAMQLMRDHEVVDLLELRTILEGAAARGERADDR